MVRAPSCGWRHPLKVLESAHSLFLPLHSPSCVASHNWTVHIICSYTLPTFAHAISLNALPFEDINFILKISISALRLGRIGAWEPHKELLCLDLQVGKVLRHALFGFTYIVFLCFVLRSPNKGVMETCTQRLTQNKSCITLGKWESRWWLVTQIDDHNSCYSKTASTQAQGCINIGGMGF